MSAWRFLLDEHIDPNVASYLEKEGLAAEHIRDSLGQGADDEDDILPYARAHDLVIVTSDVKDFGGLPNEAHSGIVLLHDDTMPAYRVASGLIRMVDVYPSRADFEGREVLDVWANQDS